MLTDLLPAEHRRRIYALVTLAAVIFGAWQASDHDWTTTVASALTALTTGMATANTAATPRGEDGCADGVVILLVAILLGVVLLLFGVRFDR